MVIPDNLSYDTLRTFCLGRYMNILNNFQQNVVGLES